MQHFLALTSDYSSDGTSASVHFSTGNPLFNLVWSALSVVGLWKCFSKAGIAGWKAIVPIYNIYLMLKLSGKPWWWLLLFLIPFANIYFLFAAAIAFAKVYGKGGAFGFFLVGLLSPIGLLIIGFGEAQYNGPARGTDIAASNPTSGGTTPPPAAPVNPAPPATPAV